jgi:hypothetical protein
MIKIVAASHVYVVILMGWAFALLLLLVCACGYGAAQLLDQITRRKDRSHLSFRGFRPR